MHRGVCQIDAGLTTFVIEVGTSVRPILSALAVMPCDMRGTISLMRQHDVHDIVVRHGKSFLA
jgi:hypothetical protein